MGISRRGMMKSAAGVGIAVLAGDRLAPADEAPANQTAAPYVAHKGRINQAVCQWCYHWEMEDFCKKAKQLGLVGIDLVGPDWFATLKKYNLVGTMTPTHSIPKGLNKKENWDECLGKIRASIDATSDAGFPSVICFSGTRAGMDDEEGLKNCTDAVKQVVGQAEKKNVTIHMELLNSKRNHPDYMCDHSAWGVRLVKAVGSERFKLLYDIYHMQIMEGDVIATIRENKDYFGHYHTAGVPGRHELDANQELQYAAIMTAIADTGFKGVVGQEFVPKRDPFQSLAQAVQICDV